MTEGGTTVMEFGAGFALEEYVCARHQPAGRIKGGTMGKAVNVPGGLTDELIRTADKAPGPGHYFKDKGVNSDFVKTAKGGTFSKLTRDYAKKVKEGGPAVGQYDTALGTAKRVLGGIMNKNDRICAFARIAERANAQQANGPGKYDPAVREFKCPTPTFASPRTESRNPKKPSGLGPGYYTPNFAQTDPRVPAYSTTKEEVGTYLLRMHKDKNPVSFANYKDMPESKVHDKAGTRRHCKKLLQDRQVMPRKRNNSITPRIAARYAASVSPREDQDQDTHSVEPEGCRRPSTVP